MTDAADAILKSPRWEDLQVAALRLTDATEDMNDATEDMNDATEDMNDALREVIDALRTMRVRPGWVPIRGLVHALIWNGTTLVYDDGKNCTPLLSASRERRLIACDRLFALYAELKRKR